MSNPAKTAVVTGASRGIGKSISEALVKKGFTVIGTSRKPENAAPFDNVPGVTYKALDLTDGAGFEGFVKSLERVDILINNAGASQMGPVEDVPLDRGRAVRTCLLRTGLSDKRHTAADANSGRRQDHQYHFICHMPVSFSAFYAAGKSALETFLKIMPVYRIRDGYGNLTKNEECFAKAAATLRERKALCLMPEGNHGNQRKLRPLLKGLFRIAFRAQAEKGNVPFVKIVPVGLDYSHYERFRARLIIRYGVPIDVSVYFPAYECNPAKGYKELGDRLRSEMKRLMLHVESGAYYDTIWALKDIYRDSLFSKMQCGIKSTMNRFTVDQQLLELLDKKSARDQEFMAQAECKMASFNSLLSELKLRTSVLNSDGEKSLALAKKTVLCLFGVPVLIYGFLNNVVAYYVASRVSRSAKDPQFRSSLKFLWGVFFVPVISMVQSLVLFCYCRSPILCAIYLVSIYLSGLLGYDIYISTERLVLLMRYWLGLHFKKSKYLALKQIHEGLVGFVDAQLS